MTSLLIMFPWCPCLLLSLDVPVVSYAAVHPPVANVLTDVYARVVPAVVSVSAVVAISTDADIPTANAVTNVSRALLVLETMLLFAALLLMLFLL